MKAAAASVLNNDPVSCLCFTELRSPDVQPGELLYPALQSYLIDWPPPRATLNPAVID